MAHPKRKISKNKKR